MIKNCDGTPYQVGGCFRMFDPNNPASGFINSLNANLFEIAGSPIFYYEVFIQVSQIDKLYLEDRSKLWSNDPVQFYGIYEPIEQQNPSGAFGIDGLGDILIECNREAVINAIGHIPKRGSRL